MSKPKTRKTFKDLDDSQIGQLSEIYYPIFDKIVTTTYKEAYEQAKDISNLSESATRGAMKNLFDIKELTSTEELISAKKQKLTYEIHKHRRDKLTFNAVVREQHDNLLLMETLRDKLTELDIQPYPHLNSRTTTSIPHIFLSDIHIGAYTKEQHRDILTNVVQEIVNNIDKGDTINLVFCGDIVDGLLRLSQLQKIKSNMVEQVTIATELILELLTSLSEDYIIHSIYFIDEDNHGQIRVLNSNRGDFPELNLSKFISKSLEQYCALKSISYYASDILQVNIAGVPYSITHGDAYKGKNALFKYFEQENLIHGHFHTYSHVTTNSFKQHIGLPALCYGDEYTKSLGINNSYAGFVIEKNGFFKNIKVETR